MSLSVVRRCALIGDVHAEHERLAIALDWAARADVDVITCTGDVVDGRGDASRCCELLLQHKVLCVSGNHDRWLFTGLLRDRPKATDLASVSPEHRKFLKTLPAYRDLDTPLGQMLLCHGIGPSDLEKSPTSTPTTPMKVNRALQGVLASRRYRLMAVFGAVVTSGLYCWESRNMQTCLWLHECAKVPQNGLKLPERGEPATLLRIPLRKTVGEGIVYTATILAWLSLGVLALVNSN